MTFLVSHKQPRLLFYSINFFLFEMLKIYCNVKNSITELKLSYNKFMFLILPKEMNCFLLHRALYYTSLLGAVQVYVSLFFTREKVIIYCIRMTSRGLRGGINPVAILRLL